MRPGIAAHPNAVAVVGGVARKALSGSDVDSAGVMRIDCDGADCAAVTRFEYRMERQPAIHGFPQASGRVPQIHNLPMSGDARNGIEPSSHDGGTDPAVMEI